MEKYKIILVLLLLPLVALSAKPVVAEPIEIVKLSDIKVYAFEKVLEKWGSEQWDSFDKIVKKESNWNSSAKNSKSSACGLGQTMMSLYGKDLKKDFCKNSYDQIDWTINYINERYGSPQKALRFHSLHNYY